MIFPMHGPFSWALLFAAGAVVSFVNSISGGGSILSLPLLIFMGLPAATANGTNRLGVLAGSLGSISGFRTQGIFMPRLAWQVGWPAALGSLAGSFIAVRLPDRVFNPILAAIILFVVVMTLRGRRASESREVTLELRKGFWPTLAYGAIGVYGGFIQAGSGLIMIYVFGRLGNLDIFRINALKVSNTLLFISVSVLSFAWAGKIAWTMGLWLALGNAVGGWAGSHWQVKKGELWVNRFLLVSGLAAAAKLLWDACWSGWH